MRYFLLAVLLLTGSCSTERVIKYRDVCTSPNKLVGITPSGVIYYLPGEWAQVHRVGIEIEIDIAAKGEKEFTVMVESGKFTIPDGRRVVGAVFIDARMIRVAFQSCGESTLLPAMMHEFEHVRCWRTTGDPDASHTGCMLGK